MTATSITSVPDDEKHIQEDVRSVTDNEVGFFHQNGWVLIPGLVSPQLCQSMLELGKPQVAHLMHGDKFASAEDRHANMQIAGANGGTHTDVEKWIEWRGAVRSAQDPTFSRAALAKTMGRNVQRLLGRNKPVRVFHDIFMCKLPDKLSTHTQWHQDSPNFPLDRNALTVWIALDEVRPNQGSLQFYSGSHRCGLLGNIPSDPTLELVDEYEELALFPVSPAPHLQPGDATVHHGLVVHGTGSNDTPDPRWSYAICYFPSDTRYTGAPNHDCDGLGMKKRDLIEHPSFALVP